MTIAAKLSLDSIGISPGSRPFCAWVNRVGAWRATWFTALGASLESLALKWLCLRMLGFAKLGDAARISLLVPVPLALLCGGINFHLIVALERARKMVHELAMVDALTGLSNRHRFVPAAKREIDLARRHGQPLAILVVDADHFKYINDAHGHLAGDQFLVEIGHRFRATLRATDLLARWGGEEFIVLLPNTPVAQAQQLAERVREAVSASAQLKLQGQEIQVTVSIGAAGATVGQALPLDGLIQLADRALYKSKRAGRDRVSTYFHENSSAADRQRAPGQPAVFQT